MLPGRRGRSTRIILEKTGRRITLDNLRWRGNRDLVQMAEVFSRACDLGHCRGDRDTYLAYYVADLMGATVILPPDHQARLNRQATDPDAQY